MLISHTTSILKATLYLKQYQATHLHSTCLPTWLLLHRTQSRPGTNAWSGSVADQRPEPNQRRAPGAGQCRTSQPSPGAAAQPQSRSTDPARRSANKEDACSRAARTERTEGSAPGRSTCEERKLLQLVSITSTCFPPPPLLIPRSARISSEWGIPPLYLSPGGGHPALRPRGLRCYRATPGSGHWPVPPAYSRPPQREKAAPPQPREKKRHQERAKRQERTRGWLREGTRARRGHPRNSPSSGMGCEQTPKHPPPRTSAPSPRGWPRPGAPSSETAANRASSHRPPLPITIAATAAGRDSPLPAPPSAPVL